MLVVRKEFEGLTSPARRNWRLPEAVTRRLGLGAAAQLALLAAAPSVAVWIVVAMIAPAGLLNDFHSYWYAGRLLAAGHSPYDLDALRALATREGDVFMVGTGYSYPLPFAQAMVPLSMLPFGIASAVFEALSLAVFAAAVAAWLRWFHGAVPLPRLRLGALLAGTFPPVIGSVLNGQANLLVGGAIAAGAALALERSTTRSAIGGVALGLASVVKLVPGVAVVPLWLAGHRRAAAGGVIAGFLVPFGLSAAISPGVALDSGKLAVLFRPDPFITNQSINGFVSRLVAGSDRMTAAAPGAFDPAPIVVALTLALAVATLAILWRARRRLARPDGLALGLALGLVAATAGAPKTSFWNITFVLVAVGLLLVATAPTLDLRLLDRRERWLLGAWWGSAFLQPLVWLIPAQSPGPGAALVAALGSLSLYGSLALWSLLGRRLLRTQADAAG